LCAGNLTNVKDSEDDGRYLEYMPYKEFTELVKDGDKSDNLKLDLYNLYSL